MRPTRIRVLIMTHNSKSVSAMECRDHLKNAASPKSRRSRGNFLISCRTVFVLGIVALFYTSCTTQRIPIEPPLAFLRGQDRLHVVLNFEDVMLQGKSEKSYLATVQPQWIEGWEEAKFTTFRESLLEQLNEHFDIRCGEYPGAQYQATVWVLSVKRAGIGQYLEGPGLREVSCEVVFTRTGDSQTLAKIRVKGNSQGKVNVPTRNAAAINTIIGSAGSNTYLTGKAFATVGQELGRLMTRQMK